jgi:plasmid stabilization system protein ParE
MSRRVIVRPLAESDLADAAAWYERERAGLSEKFFDDLNRTLSSIGERMAIEYSFVSEIMRRRCP